MSRTRYRFSEPDRPYFLTCTVVEWLPVFTRRETVDILLDSWQYLRHHDSLKIYGYVVLENHLHAVAGAENLPDVWRRFKSFTGRRPTELLTERGLEIFLKRMRLARKADRNDRKYQFWQEGSHPQAIQDERMLRQKLDYIHLNPVKRGYVSAPEHWLWSSAAVYAGQEGIFEVDMIW